MSAAVIGRAGSLSDATASSVARTFATTASATAGPARSSSAIANRFGATRLPSIHDEEMLSERISRWFRYRREPIRSSARASTAKASSAACRAAPPTLGQTHSQLVGHVRHRCLLASPASS